MLIGPFLVRLGRHLSVAANASSGSSLARQGCVGLRPQSPRKGPFRHLKLFVSEAERSTPMTLYPHLPSQPSSFPSGRYAQDRPAAPRVRAAPAQRAAAGAAAHQPDPRLAASRPLRWQAGHPEPAPPAPRRSQLISAHAGAAGRSFADRIGSLAPRGGNAAHQHQPRHAQHAARAPRASYLRSLYAALVFQLGEAAALAEFERLVLSVV